MSFRAVSKFSQPFRDALELLRYGRKELRVSGCFGDTNAAHINVSNFLFQLHSKVTVVMLLMGTTMVTMKLFGDPVDCLAHQGAVSKEMLQRFCWMEGAFSIHHPPDVEQAYPGVGPHTPGSGNGRRVNHRYYQWVYFVLILQAIMFYAPKHVWRAKEANQLRTIIHRLRQAPLNLHPPTVQKLLLQEMFDILLVGDNFLYYFVVCELFYLVNLVAQFWFTNVFLGGSFLNLGWRWFVYANQPQLDIAYDPLVKVFPRLVKCNFHYYGISGSVVLQDALCFLPINIINEKIYVILWMWFVFLFLLTLGYFSFHLLLVLSAQLRYMKLRFHAPTCSGKQLRLLVRNPGNWFVLEFIAINLKPHFFKELVAGLFEEFYDKDGYPRVEQTVMNKYRDQLIGRSGGHAPLHSYAPASAPAPPLPPPTSGNKNRSFFASSMMEQSNNSGGGAIGGRGGGGGGGGGEGGGGGGNQVSFEGFGALGFAAAAKNATFGKKVKKGKLKPTASSGSHSLRQYLQHQAMDDNWPEPNEQSELLQAGGRRSPEAWDLALEDDSRPLRKNRKDDMADAAAGFALMFDERHEMDDELDDYPELSKKKPIRSSIKIKKPSLSMTKAGSERALDDNF